MLLLLKSEKLCNKPQTHKMCFRRHTKKKHVTNQISSKRHMCHGLNSLYWGWSSHLLIWNPYNWIYFHHHEVAWKTQNHPKKPIGFSNGSWSFIIHRHIHQAPPGRPLTAYTRRPVFWSTTRMVPSDPPHCPMVGETPMAWCWWKHRLVGSRCPQLQ